MEESRHSRKSFKTLSVQTAVALLDLISETQLQKIYCQTTMRQLIA